MGVLDIYVQHNRPSESTIEPLKEQKNTVVTLVYKKSLFYLVQVLLINLTCSYYIGFSETTTRCNLKL